MANGNGGGGNSALALIVGILIAVLVIGGFFVFGGYNAVFGGGSTHTINVNVKGPGKGG